MRMIPEPPRFECHLWRQRAALAELRAAGGLPGCPQSFKLASLEIEERS